MSHDHDGHDGHDGHDHGHGVFMTETAEGDSGEAETPLAAPPSLLAMLPAFTGTVLPQTRAPRASHTPREILTGSDRTPSAAAVTALRTSASGPGGVAGLAATGPAALPALGTAGVRTGPVSFQERLLQLKATEAHLESTKHKFDAAMRDVMAGQQRFKNKQQEMKDTITKFEKFIVEQDNKIIRADRLAENERRQTANHV